MADRYRICDKCGVMVSKLGKHLRRNRCAAQHQRKGKSFKAMK